MKKYLIRDATCGMTVILIVSLESEEQWNKAKKYVKDCRNNGRNSEADSDLIEEYFQRNNIKYEWNYFDKELTL